MLLLHFLVLWVQKNSFGEGRSWLLSSIYFCLCVFVPIVNAVWVCMCIHECLHDWGIPGVRGYRAKSGILLSLFPLLFPVFKRNCIYWFYALTFSFI